MLYRRLRSGVFALCFAFLGVGGSGAFAEVPDVVASIKPINSLVASVMKGVGEPVLLVQRGNSPHTYTLRPSDARALSDADVVFWIGGMFETFLVRPLETLPREAEVVTLSEAPGLTLLPNREGGAWEPHDHGHDHDGDHDHDHGEAGHAEGDHDHAHAGEDHHHEGPVDGHIWLAQIGTASRGKRRVRYMKTTVGPDP